MGGLHAIPLSICITLLFAINGEAVTPRETLEIIIGVGAPSSPPPEFQDCPPPPPPPCPPPPSTKPPSRKPPPPPSPSLSPPPPPPPPSPRPPKPPQTPSPPGGFFDGFANMLQQRDFKVIQAFKNKVTSDPTGITKTWKGKNICDYQGFICDVVPDVKQRGIAGVNFNNRNLYGPNLTLTEFLTGLKDIAFFHANSNNFTGSIPADIGTLRYLLELDLSNNKFTGSFPYQVLHAKKLVFLDLRFNTFSGVVHPDVFLLDLDLLFINNNNFKQTLPESLGSTTALYLTLANNHFIGEISKSIGRAAKTLQEVLFLNNQLTGCLPYEIGLLKKSTVFDVGFNDLTGPIPHSFQCLEKMELLNLAHNKFYNEVPEAVCNLPELSNFTVSYNYFTQVGPRCRELIKKEILDVKMNCILDLPNQRSPTDCARFFSNLPSCPDKKSLTYIPCSKGYSSNDQLEASNVQWATPSPAPAPLWRSYGALSPN
ncbi:unnamed protein product [Lactuca virosa]|uniref:Leucine-rich repeat-containing N-terminal plant-type domain-containing protein n=1 Tax=Lactuca virosa TaxID=75947 RepID=A0AAU9MDX0_9ASTR|nr:unnamed protein product [Lactuca virosa]